RRRLRCQAYSFFSRTGLGGGTWRFTTGGGEPVGLPTMTVFATAGRGAAGCAAAPGPGMTWLTFGSTGLKSVTHILRGIADALVYGGAHARALTHFLDAHLLQLQLDGVGLLPVLLLALVRVDDVAVRHYVEDVADFGRLNTELAQIVGVESNAMLVR